MNYLLSRLLPGIMQSSVYYSPVSYSPVSSCSPRSFDHAPGPLRVILLDGSLRNKQNMHMIGENLTWLPQCLPPAFFDSSGLASLQSVSETKILMPSWYGKDFYMLIFA
ncbi:hypothetical protein M413DRAFT_195117 [Hebeloma cylindrosporum]|uniref:Uncharacterized protein n=1 Tax=Hebeloma cylindrosporum TaxID=76867 RepID=A0A0C3C7Z2_HEBCY|nr:hypothetical protein M413DRAFT_195117 [Hebeloma cylindrosporum h7]